MLIERHGLVWKIKGDHTIAHYVNGDPAIVGPVLLLAVTPSEGNAPCASSVNPRPGKYHGIAPTSSGYDPTLDANLSLPMTLRAGDSLLSCVEKDQPGETPQLRTAAVLTIVEELPRESQFRPAYAGPQRSMDVMAEFSKTADDLIHPAPLVPSMGVDVPSFDDSSIERVWPDFLWGWGGRYLHPSENMPDYGRDMGVLIGSAALSLCFRSDEASRRTLINLVQIGIDNYGCYKNGGKWPGNGGHASSRITPIIIAAAALGIEEMMDIDATRFGEGSQTFFVEETSPGVFNNGYGGYGPEHKGMAEWGHAHTIHNEMDDVSWEGSYRFCCTANAWVGQVTALRLMGLLPAVNHDAWPMYLDRYLRRTKAEGTPGWWRHYNQPWHEQAYDVTRMPDMPGTDSFGFGPYKLTADMPPSLVEGSMRVSINGPKFGKVLLAVSSKPKMIPNQSPPIPAGINFEGFCYLEGITAMIDKNHDGSTAFDIPLPQHLKAGNRFYLQAFVLDESSNMRSSNALALTLLG